MNNLTPLDPLDVYERGLRDPDALTPEERMVYLLVELETYADMEGWDHFFTTDKLRYYPELKSGLVACCDRESLLVLEDYENHFLSHGVPLEAGAIADFVFSQDNAYLASCPDWRADYSKLGPARWQKVKDYLAGRGGAMT